MAAVASSDSHHAGEAPEGPTQSPVGIGATVVRAKQLSERGVRCAVKAGHTYAKIGGSKGPDLRFTGRVGRRTAIFGDFARGKRLKLRGRATGGGTLQLVRDGRVIATGTRTLQADGHRVRALRPPARARPGHRGGRHADLVHEARARARVTTRGC